MFNPSKKIIADYTSVGNDIADVNLKIFSNNKYLLEIDVLGENTDVKMKGRWVEVSDEYVLDFKTPSKAKSFFDTHKKIGCESTKIKDKHISFPKKAAEICIWQILCYNKSL